MNSLKINTYNIIKYKLIKFFFKPQYSIHRFNCKTIYKLIKSLIDKISNKLIKFLLKTLKQMSGFDKLLVQK